MSKRSAEQVTSLFADYGTDDEEDSEHEGSGKQAGNLLLAYGEDEEDNTSVGANSADNDRPTQPAGATDDHAAATSNDNGAASGDAMDAGDDAPGTSSEAPEGAVNNEPGDAPSKDQQRGVEDAYLLLPAELRDPPPGEPAPEGKARVEGIFRAQQRHGVLLSNELKSSRGYQNPDFLRKMVDFLGIRERGSCFPRDVFDPDGLEKEDHVKELKRQWQKLDARRAQQKQERMAVDYTKGGVQAPPAASAGLHMPTAAATAAAILQAQAKASLMANASKKTKWDLGGK